MRLRRPVDIWHKPALSAVVALAIPDLALLFLDRLDLILYTSAGAMCALYAHGLPYAARARTLAWVVLGMVASLGVALTAAALIASTALLVVLASLLAAAHKVVCDATRIGLPGNLILTFIAASGFFVPQRLGQVPAHLALALGAGLLAWLVCMAPALVRPQGPERIATARALEAAAGLLRTEPGAGGAAATGVAHARHAAAAAVNAARHTLFLVPAARSPKQAAGRSGLERLLMRAEAALGDTGGREPEGGDAQAETPSENRPRARSQAQTQGRTQAAPRGEAQAAVLAAWAHDLRRGRPLPDVSLSVARAEEAEAEEQRGREGEGIGGVGQARRDSRPGDAVAGTAAEAVGLGRSARDHPRGLRAVASRLAPGSPLLPIGVRVAAGCVLAGWASMAVGVGHPYWAVVTAASIYQANTTLSWQRALQRTLGNLLGLLLFTALLPVIRTGPLAMVALALACQLGAEACISRNYWLGSVWVTPMALLLTEFGTHRPVATLIADRWIDTVVGAAVGLVCCVAVTNRRAADRVEGALERLAEAESAVLHLLTAGVAPGADEAREIRWARDRLAGCLVELREAAEVAAGEWWQRAVPQERIAGAEERGHRALAGAVRRLGASPAGRVRTTDAAAPTPAPAV